MPIVRTPVEDEGMVLVLVVAGLAGLFALALAVALLATVDVEVDAVARGTMEAMATAEAGVELALAELAGEPDWSAVLSGAVASRDLTAGVPPVVPGWGALDLATRTLDIQRGSDGAVWRDNAPVWRLYVHGRIGDVLSRRVLPASPYAAVWLADDEGETDGDPRRDGNGVVSVRAEAYGAARTHQVVLATVRRRPHGVEVVSWRVPADRR